MDLKRLIEKTGLYPHVLAVDAQIYGFGHSATQAVLHTAGRLITVVRLNDHIAPRSTPSSCN